jgi:hypothetical protein
MRDADTSGAHGALGARDIEGADATGTTTSADLA